MSRDGSRSLRAAKILRCFTGRFTELSDSELPNSTVTEVTYRSLMNFISAVWAMWRSVKGLLVELVWFLLDWSFWTAGEVSSVFFKLEGEVMIDVRAVRYCVYVEIWGRSIFF